MFTEPPRAQQEPRWRGPQPRCPGEPIGGQRGHFSAAQDQTPDTQVSGADPVSAGSRGGLPTPQAADHTCELPQVSRDGGGEGGWGDGVAGWSGAGSGDISRTRLAPWGLDDTPSPLSSSETRTLAFGLGRPGTQPWDRRTARAPPPRTCRSDRQARFAHRASSCSGGHSEDTVSATVRGAATACLSASCRATARLKAQGAEGRPPGCPGPPPRPPRADGGRQGNALRSRAPPGPLKAPPGLGPRHPPVLLLGGAPGQLQCLLPEGGTETHAVRAPEGSPEVGPAPRSTKNGCSQQGDPRSLDGKVPTTSPVPKGASARSGHTAPATGCAALRCGHLPRTSPLLQAFRTRPWTQLGGDCPRPSFADVAKSPPRSLPVTVPSAVHSSK